MQEERRPYEDETLLSWRVHLVKRYPWRGVGVVLGVLVVGVVLSLVLGLVGAILLGALLLFSVGPFFVPQQYRLTRRAVHIRRGFRWKVYPWATFQRVVQGKDRLLLSTFPSSHPLEGLRGVVVWPAGDNIKAIGQVLSRHIKGGLGETEADQVAALEK
jgi:hypothetical protein